MTRSPEPLLKILGYEFKDLSLLQQALTHRSAGSRNNERLEFLGDAMLGCVIAGELYRLYPRAREGELSRLRASLVRGESLKKIARDLDIGQYLYLGPGERRSGGHARNSILSDAVEALFGAIYLDAGFDACKKCILALFSGRLDDLPEGGLLKDPKTRLQEYLQSRRLPLPEYTVTDVNGEAHNQSFTVQCLVDEAANVGPTQGQGKSRRKAEQTAAELMLQQLDGG
ncbi:MAG: ribonuclease III [Gammaproteobacteria bacterium]